MSEQTSEILLFRLGARTWGTPVGGVRRIGATRDAADVVVESILGAPLRSGHGLVVGAAEDGAERTVAVDGVLGIKSVPSESVLPLPAFAAACLRSAAVTGYVMLDDAPTLLVDLQTLVHEQLAAHATERP